MIIFCKNTDSPTSKDLEIAAVVGVQENQSFRCKSCSSKLIQTCFEQKFGNARTKTEAIVVNLLVPIVIGELRDHLSKCNYVSILTNASNHTSKKIFHILV